MEGIDLKRRLLIALCIFLFIALCLVLAVCLITFEITLETDGNGTLVCQKQKVHLFESATVLIAPYEQNEIYILNSITVNDEDVTKDIKFNKLKIRFILSDKCVKATFVVADENIKAISSAVFV